MGKIAEAALILLVAGLAVALAVSWPEQRLPSPQEASSAGPPETPRGVAPEGPEADPELVARLFGWTKPAPQPPAPAVETTRVVEPPPEEPAQAAEPAPPVVVDWLRYVGYSGDAEGRSLYYLKDARTGKLITVAQGWDSAEWSLVEATEDRLVVRSGSVEYLVDRR